MSKIIELLINDEDGFVDKISIVNNPAIEVDFMYFNKQETFKIVDNDRRVVTGPAMIPNMLIDRLDENGELYKVFFSEASIIKASQKYFKNNNNNNVNTDHINEVDGVSIFESWIVEDADNDKSKKLGFSGLPNGTWMISYLVDNDQVWEDVKMGKFKGFSIEGSFIEQKSDEDLYQDIMDLLKLQNTDNTFRSIVSLLEPHKKKYLG